MKTAAMIFALALVGSQALAQEQIRIYGPDGRSLGTAGPTALAASGTATRVAAPRSRRRR
jgi:hypothetical protein